MTEQFDYSRYLDNPKERIAYAKGILIPITKLPNFALMKLVWMGGFGTFWRQEFVRPGDIDIALDGDPVIVPNQKQLAWLGDPLVQAFKVSVNFHPLQVLLKSFRSDQISDFLGDVVDLYGKRPDWL